MSGLYCKCITMELHTLKNVKSNNLCESLLILNLKLQICIEKCNICLNCINCTLVKFMACTAFAVNIVGYQKNNVHNQRYEEKL